MPTDAYAQALRSLGDLGPMRVWSLLVTVFGDLAPDRPLNGPTLSAIMGEIGIKPEASRVALHRLRSDGWIASAKKGRTSLHALTAKGQSDSDAARQRIYGETQAESAIVVVTANATDLDPTRFAQIAPTSGSGLGVSIAQTVAEGHGGSLVLVPLENGLRAEMRLPLLH